MTTEVPLGPNSPVAAGAASVVVDQRGGGRHRQPEPTRPVYDERHDIPANVM